MGKDRPTQRPPARGSILVVDDDPKLRSGLARILRGEGHPVIEASDGSSALDLMRAYDLGVVVLDYAMPGIDGGAVVEQMQEMEDAPTPVLLTAGRHQRSRAREMGVRELAKPFRVEDLLATIQDT
ncbi:MAG: response regulator [Myxococcota bacterium]